MLKRRMIIETSILGNILLDSCLLYCRASSKWKNLPEIDLDNQHPYRFLTAQDRAALVAFSGVLLDNQLGAVKEKADVLIEITRDVDNAIAGYTDAFRAEMRDLFDLLHFPLIRKFLAGIKDPWHVADKRQLELFFDRCDGSDRQPAGKQ